MLRTTIVIIAALALLATVATARDFGYGPRAGYTSAGSLDQIHLGGHLLLPVIAPNVHVIPSAEIGFGDGTLFAANGDVVYEFTEVASHPWSFYAGGGPTFTHFAHDGHDQTDFALSAVVGTTYSIGTVRSAFGEVRLGLEDAPDLKLTVGFSFH